MKNTKISNLNFFTKGATALLLAGSIFTACTNDLDMEPTPVAATAKQKSEQFSANSLSAELSAEAATTFVAPLNGKEEVPTVDTKATGNAIFKLVGDEIHYKLIVANIENVTMAHLHMAAAGSNGRPVVWLLPSGPPPSLIAGKSNGILAEGVITAESLVGPLASTSIEALLDAMREGNIYVNVHTAQFPGGEIRGQVKPAGKN